MNLANEGLEARKKDEEVAQRKRKAEDDKTWEGMCNLPLADTVSEIFFIIDNREQRVDSWRNFASSSKKKKKTKTVILG